MSSHRSWAGTAVLLVLLTGCGPAPGLSAADDRLQVVTTTGLLRDLVENVGGDRVHAVSLVPDGGDPHSFEPTLRDVRDVVYADVAFSNYMLLEQHNIIKTLDANLGDGVPNISLAEDAVKYAAEIIPLVENVNLDTIWLGLRARGDGARHGADRSSDVLLSATDVSGPGKLYGYLTGTFGEAEVYFNSRDGFDAASGFKDDTATLPADAHTHMSWVFTAPGVYTVTLAASLRVDATSRPVTLGRATFTFAVGVKPSGAGRPGATVLKQGHADLTADLDSGEVYALYDAEGGGEGTQVSYRADQIERADPGHADRAGSRRRTGPTRTPTWPSWTISTRTCAERSAGSRRTVATSSPRTTRSPTSRTPTASRSPASRVRERRVCSSRESPLSPSAWS